MKELKPSELRSMTQQELDLKERTLRERLQKARFGKFTGELTNTAQIKSIRKELARLLTERRMRALKGTQGERS